MPARITQSARDWLGAGDRLGSRNYRRRSYRACCRYLPGQYIAGGSLQGSMTAADGTIALTDARDPAVAQSGRGGAMMTPIRSPVPRESASRVCPSAMKLIPASSSAIVMSRRVRKCKVRASVSKSAIVLRATPARSASLAWVQRSMARAARHCAGDAIRPLFILHLTLSRLRVKRALRNPELRRVDQCTGRGS